MVLYINDIDSASTRWKGVFLAGTDSKDISRLTLAEEAIVIPDRNEGKLELHLRNGSVHEFSPSDPGRYSLSAFGQRDFPVEIKGAESRPRFRSWASRKADQPDFPATSDRARRRCRIPASPLVSLRLRLVRNAGHAPGRASPPRRPRCGIPDHSASGKRLLPDVYPRRGTCPPGLHSCLGRNLGRQHPDRRDWTASASHASNECPAAAAPACSLRMPPAGTIWKIFHRPKIPRRLPRTALARTPQKVFREEAAGAWACRNFWISTSCAASSTIFPC